MNALQFTKLLHSYEEKHQRYPDHLHYLVTDVLLDETTYDSMRVRPGIWTTPQDWQYFQISNPSDYVLFSGVPVPGSNTPRYIIARADGQIETFGQAKLPAYQRMMAAQRVAPNE